MSDQSRSRPSNLIIVVDDVGFSDLQPFGGEIRTLCCKDWPNAGHGFASSTRARCAPPSRAMLLSGCDNHQAGLDAACGHRRRSPTRVGRRVDDDRRGTSTVRAASPRPSGCGSQGSATSRCTPCSSVVNVLNTLGNVMLIAIAKAMSRQNTVMFLDYEGADPPQRSKRAASSGSVG